MPRRVERTGPTGWVSWESKHNYILRMSWEQLWDVRERNKALLDHKSQVMKSLEEAQKLYRKKADVKMDKVCLEYTRMQAYREVYRQYSFTRQEGRTQGQGGNTDDPGTDSQKKTVKDMHHYILVLKDRRALQGQVGKAHFKRIEEPEDPINQSDITEGLDSSSHMLQDNKSIAIMLPKSKKVENLLTDFKTEEIEALNEVKNEERGIQGSEKSRKLESLDNISKAKVKYNETEVVNINSVSNLPPLTAETLERATEETKSEEQKDEIKSKSPALSRPRCSRHGDYLAALYRRLKIPPSDRTAMLTSRGIMDEDALEVKVTQTKLCKRVKAVKQHVSTQRSRVLPPDCRNIYALPMLINKKAEDLYEEMSTRFKPNRPMARKSLPPGCTYLHKPTRSSALRARSVREAQENATVLPRSYTIF